MSSPNKVNQVHIRPLAQPVIQESRNQDDLSKASGALGESKSKYNKTTEVDILDSRNLLVSSNAQGALDNTNQKLNRIDTSGLDFKKFVFHPELKSVSKSLHIDALKKYYCKYNLNDTEILFLVNHFRHQSRYKDIHQPFQLVIHYATKNSSFILKLFYLNLIVCPYYVTIDYIHKYWRGNQFLLDTNFQSYYWLFPNTQSGKILVKTALEEDDNYFKFFLNEQDLLYMRNSVDVMPRYIISYLLILEYLGFDLAPGKEGAVDLESGTLREKNSLSERGMYFYICSDVQRLFNKERLLALVVTSLYEFGFYEYAKNLFVAVIKRIALEKSNLSPTERGKAIYQNFNIFKHWNVTTGNFLQIPEIIKEAYKLLQGVGSGSKYTENIFLEKYKSEKTSRASNILWQAYQKFENAS